MKLWLRVVKVLAPCSHVLIAGRYKNDIRATKFDCILRRALSKVESFGLLVGHRCQYTGLFRSFEKHGADKRIYIGKAKSSKSPKHYQPRPCSLALCGCGRIKSNARNIVNCNVLRC